MYIQITGMTTWGVAVEFIIEAAHRWPVVDDGQIDLTPPDGDIDPEFWLTEWEPEYRWKMSNLLGVQWDDDDYELFLELTVREAPPDQINHLTGQPTLPSFEPLIFP